MYPEVGLVEETKGGGKEGKKESNTEIHHFCIGIRHTETS
jgi:hypothetical protein